VPFGQLGAGRNPKSRSQTQGEEHMKSLSELHKKAIIKAQNETDQNKAAALAMIEKPIEMIKAIMLKHEIAVIEVMRELHESREAAVRAERQRIANLLMVQHEAAKGSHNYWHVAANLIKAESGENV
jgi:hypothetical protein